MILNLRGQKLTIENATVSEGAKNYVTFEVKCDKEWKKLNKTVRFKHENDLEIYDIAGVREKEVYYLPEGVLKKGKVEIGVVGVKGADTVVTTSVGEVEVNASIDSGRTPAVKSDAYASYVDKVLSETKKCEKALKVILEARKEILNSRKECEAFFIGAKKALYESREILEKVSGALDAVGVILRDMKREEQKLLNFDSKLVQNEENRILSEKERILKESMRDKGEALREEREKERMLFENSRLSSEKARGLMDIKREEQINDITYRLSYLENKCETYIEEKCFQDKAENIKGAVYISLTPNADTENTSPIINDEVHTFSTPLKRIDDICDKIVFEKDRTYVERHLHTLTLDGSEEITEGEREGEWTLFAIELPKPSLLEGQGKTNFFSYGRQRDTESLWVSGNYLLLRLKISAFELSKKLRDLKEKGTPLEVTYSLLKEEREELIFFPIENVNTIVLEGYSIVVRFSKNIISTLSILFKKIGELENKLQEKENKNEFETKTLIS